MAFASFTTYSEEALLKALSATKSGLTTAEASTRLNKNGPNEIASDETGPLTLLLRQLKSPFNYLLTGAALISFAMGDHLEGGLIFLFIVINTLLGFSQEYHSNKALKLLKQFVVTNARVRRNGHEQTIPSRELVVGDVILLEAGDIIPADARVIEIQALTVDESILTGESIQVTKITEALSKESAQAFEAKNILFSGTHIASGRAIGIVIGTGKDTAVGTISHLTGETRHESSFEKGIGKFSGFILRLVLITLVLVFIAHLIFKRGEISPFELLLFSIALAVSVIPEALPIVTTISLSKGALKLAQNHVVVKRLSAIEDLGSIEVLCTDKTGTITENRMKVAAVEAEDKDCALRYATLASACLGEKERDANNAFDIALWKNCDAACQRDLQIMTRKGEIPFDPERKRNSVLVQEGTSHLLIVRGAPETILKACSTDKKEQDHLTTWVTKQGILGHRVLAVASKSMGTTETYAVKDEETGMTLHGLIAFEDPVKASTHDAIQDAQKLGIAVKILTGDSKEVAGAVAQQIGLIDNEESVLTGAEFEVMTDAERAMTVREHHVFARVSPEQKHAIIQELKKHFEVGFLGEGINDAPALKAANVGIVVQEASDVAREAADIVLLEQSLEVIIRGVREGREVFANTLKYIKATLAANFGNFYAVAISSFFIKTLPMLPLQLLLVNLLSDFPMIGIATDTVDIEELRRPRSYQPREIIKAATVLGIVSTVFDFLFFSLFFRNAPAILQTNWFMGSILTELIFIFSIRTQLPFWRSTRPSNAILGLTSMAALATLILPYTNVGQRWFQFIPPSGTHLSIILSVTVLFFIASELTKLTYEKYTKHLTITSSGSHS